MRLYSTLKGGNSNRLEYLEIFNELNKLATQKGFLESSQIRLPKLDQTNLDDWTLEFKGSPLEQIEFLLAVTAPKMPLCSPIPIFMDVSGLLFSVILNKNYFTLWDGHLRRFISVENISDIKIAFENFLINIKYNS